MEAVIRPGDLFRPNEPAICHLWSEYVYDPDGTVTMRSNVAEPWRQGELEPGRQALVIAIIGNNGQHSRIACLLLSSPDVHDVFRFAWDHTLQVVSPT